MSNLGPGKGDARESNKLKLAALYNKLDAGFRQR